MKALLAAAILAVPIVVPDGACARDWGVFSAVMLASDYRYQGVSESRGHAVMQGYAHWQDRAGYFVGVFGTQVDFGYEGAPTYEIDAYAGKNIAFDRGRGELKLEVMSSTYPDNRTPGPTLDFLQASIQAKHVSGPWTVIGVGAYVPEGSYGSGPVKRIEGEVDYAVAPDLLIKALAGNQGGGRGHERSYASLSVIKSWKSVSFELRYVATDRTRQTCGFQPTACDPGLVGVLTVALPPLP
jgi:uncharacterized protein (TIGR02001 family)